MKPEQDKINNPESSNILSTSPDQLKHLKGGLKVPENYFDTLSQRIMEKRIQPEYSFLEAISIWIRKPIVWSPALAIALLIVTLIYSNSYQKDSVVEKFDTLKELNLAYDASFSEEVLLSESKAINAELNNSALLANVTDQFTGVDQLTAEEITQYLKEQEIETELLTKK